MGAYTTTSTGTDVVARRLGAYLVDAAFASAMSWVLVQRWYLDNRVESVECGGPVGACVGTGEYALHPADVQELRIRLGASVVIWLLNHVVFQGLTGATVGKLPFGIRTVNATTYGRPGVVRSFFRSLLLPVDAIIGWLSMLLSATNQRLGDRFAGTRVVSLSWYGIAPDATRLPGRGREGAGSSGASPSAMPIPGARTAGADVPPSAYRPKRPPGMGPNAAPVPTPSTPSTPSPSTPSPGLNPFSIPGPPPEQPQQQRPAPAHAPPPLPRQREFRPTDDPDPS